MAGILLPLLPSCGLFGMSNEHGKARIAMQRIEVWVFFNAQVAISWKPVVNGLTQELDGLGFASLVRSNTAKIVESYSCRGTVRTNPLIARMHLVI